MSPIRIDFSEADSQGGDFTPMEPGRYQAHVFDAVVKEGKESKKPYINWDLQIDGPKYAGRHQWYMTSLDPKAVWKLKQMLLRLGTPGDQLSAIADVELKDYIGKKCTILVGMEQYNGQERDRVVDVFPPEEGSESASDAPAALFR